jgi:hypothetical protein
MTVQVVLREQSELLKEVSCNNCLALLRYAPVDVETFKSVDYTGGVDLFKHISCPVCSNKVIIK